MKRLLLFFSLVLITTISANAQMEDEDDLACIADGIELKSGPGSNYSCLMSKESKKRKLQLFTPITIRKSSANYNDNVKIIEELEYAGKKQNGYLYVYCSYELDNGYSEDVFGWVEAKYIRLACEDCYGLCVNLLDGKTCTTCHGRGY